MTSSQPRRHDRRWFVTVVAALAGAAVWVATPAALVTTNSAAITIPDVGTAAPYPSEITVAGMTGTVKSVRVTLHNVSHTLFDDVGAVLVGPGGQAFLLIDGIGGDAPTSNVTLTLSDAAASDLPNTGAPTSGVWRPTGHYTSSTFPSPGPLLAYAHPGPAGGGTATLNGTFAGTNPNGTWRLYIRDFVAVDGGSIAGGWSLDISTSAPASKPFDFDGDGKADASVARLASGVVTWYIQRSSTGVLQAAPWGGPSDQFTPSDYDGDGRTDVTIWRPTAPSQFYVLNSSNGAPAITNWGLSGDDARLAGDYDGDGKSDHVIRRPGATPTSQSTFYVRRSSDGVLQAAAWGLSQDFAAPGDFDGDGRFDFAVQRAIGGGVAAFFVLQSSGGSTAVQWGLPTDPVVPGDYDGDGKYDIAVARSQAGSRIWYIRQSSTGTLFAAQWGTSTDVLTPADFDGDGKTDIAVWRASEGRFYIRRSSDGGLTAINWGLAGDFPIPASFVH